MNAIVGSWQAYLVGLVGWLIEEEKQRKKPVG
jgi:hypothetical protein